MNLIEENKQISNNFRSFLENQGEKGATFLKHYQMSYQDGIFDEKTKRLMAMCGAIMMGCKGCILAQTNYAIENGATAEEILETCSVMLSLGGTMAGSEIALIMKLLKEKDML